MITYFSGWKAICHCFSQSSSAARSCRRSSVSFLLKMGLYSRQQYYGVRGRTLQWTKDFLNNRLQQVLLDGHTSSTAEVLSGVPQVTVRDPLLFLTFINDNVWIWSRVVCHSGCCVCRNDPSPDYGRYALKAYKLLKSERRGDSWMLMSVTCLTL
jgi:hypothetical protein